MVLLGLVSSRVTVASLVINEFLPDPEGADSGREYVELLNTGAEPLSLEDVALQFGNGAEGAVWSTRWSGGAGETLAAGARYLIVDRNWQGTAAWQAQVYLALQNGPDAIRLVRGEIPLDLVGYGPLTDPDMMEGAPVETAPGRALARRPDGKDSGNNSLDFVATDPTPGQRNFDPYSLAVESWEMDPPSLDRSGRPVLLTVVITNDGTETIPVGPVYLRAWGRDHPALLDEWPPERQLRLSWVLVPDLLGQWPLVLLVPLTVLPDTLVQTVASLQVGPGAVVLNEVMAAPDQGQGEWVELAIGQAGPVNLAGYSLRDQDGSWKSLPETALFEGMFLVLAQDSLALLDWHRENLDHGAVSDCEAWNGGVALRQLGGWPSLNNSPPEDRDFADRLYLADSLGQVVDHLTLTDGRDEEYVTLPPGSSLERQGLRPPNPGASNWAVCTAAAGSTPGCPNSVSRTGAVPAALTVVPRVLEEAAGVSVVHFLFSLDGTLSGWNLRVFDLWGSLVRDLGGEDLGPGPRDLLWDGRDDRGRPAGPGGYVVLLELRDRSGHVLARSKALMAIR